MHLHLHLHLVLGQVRDAAGLRAWWDERHRRLAATEGGAGGWLGSTGGVTADGRVALVARFAGAPGHQLGPAPDPAATWAGVEAHLDGPATVLATGDVTTVHESEGEWSAGFVQVMRARVGDRERFEALEAEIGPVFVALRPDVRAARRAWFGDGTVAAVDAFNSEAEARAGEAVEFPPAVQAAFGAWLALLGDTEWYDVTDPWNQRPGR